MLIQVWCCVALRCCAASVVEACAAALAAAGGMERPTDTYKRTHNLVLKPRDSIFGGQVSRLQVGAASGTASDAVVHAWGVHVSWWPSYVMGPAVRGISRSLQLALNDTHHARVRRWRCALCFYELAWSTPTAASTFHPHCHSPTAH